MTSAVAVAVFVVGLIVSIMVHEWGHFATARRFGMRADRFFLGFGPTVWSTRVGETEYGVKALPLGGFVRIAGMSPEDERLPSVPTALAQAVDAGEDPVEAFGRLLDERGTPTRVREHLVARFSRTLAAGGDATAGTPSGVDLDPRVVGLADEDAVDRPMTIAETGSGRAQAAAGDDGHAGEHGHDDVHAAATRVTTLDPVMLAVELINSEVVPTGRVGDLHHRLTQGDEDRFFHDRPAWQRTIVLASGSVLHFVQAAGLIFIGWLLVGPPVVVPVVSSFADVPQTDGTVVESAAREAGLEVGDRIVAVGDVVGDDFEEQLAVIQESPGEPLDVTVQREGVEAPLRFTVTPKPVEGEDGEIDGLFGFVPTYENQAMDADEALYRTFVGPGSFPDLFVQTFRAIGSVFGPEGIAGIFSQVAGEEERDAEGGVSLIGAASAAGEGTDAFGPLFLFSLLASVNVFVGIFNAVPLPPLDGGHIAVLAVEETVNARRRLLGRRADYRVDPRTVASIALPVIVLVATVSLALVYLDLTNPLSLQ